MARAGAALTFDVKVKDEKVLAALRESRREINQDVKGIMLESAERHAVPLANAYAPSFVKGSVIARATTRDAYLTFSRGLRGEQRAAATLLEVGGTIRTELVPKNARALRLANGVFVSRVRGPRTIRAKRYMQRAAQTARPRFVRDLERKVPAVIQARIDRT